MYSIVDDLNVSKTVVSFGSHAMLPDTPCPPIIAGASPFRQPTSCTYGPLPNQSPSQSGRASCLPLPHRPHQAADANLRPFDPPEAALQLAHELLRSNSRQRTAIHDLASGSTTLFNHSNGDALRLLPTDSPISQIENDTLDEDTYTIAEGDPLSAKISCNRTIKLGRNGWHVRIQTQNRMSCDAENFHLFNSVRCFENEQQVFEKITNFSAQRNFPLACFIHSSPRLVIHICATKINSSRPALTQKNTLDLTDLFAPLFLQPCFAVIILLRQTTKEIEAITKVTTRCNALAVCLRMTLL